MSASSPFRRCGRSPPSFVDTVAALASQAGRRVIVTSGPSERDAANGIITGARGRLSAGDRHRVLDCGDFSLAELRALLERSALYIGGDSGPLHVAATTRVPIVAIFGPTPSERSAPWRDPGLAVGADRNRRASPAGLCRSARLRARRFPVPDGHRFAPRVIAAAGAAALAAARTTRTRRTAAGPVHVTTRFDPVRAGTTGPTEERLHRRRRSVALLTVQEAYAPRRS